MFNSDDVRVNDLIGALAMELVTEGRQVTVNHLINKLDEQTRTERSQSRLALMQNVRDWLEAYIGHGSRDKTRANWMGGNYEETLGNNLVIRLNPRK